jgi:hypothetical protein
MPMRLVRKASLVALLLLITPPLSTQAHVVHERSTLSHFVSSADLIVVGAIEGPAQIAQSPTTGYRTQALTVRVERVLKGRTDERQISFVGFGRSIPHYEPGERALLFLTRIEKEKRMARRGLGARFRWFTFQEQEQGYAIKGKKGETFVAGVARLVSIDRLSPERRLEALRNAIVAFAESDASELRANALNELHEIGDVGEVLRKGDVKRLDRTLERPEVPVAERVALIAILSEIPRYDAAGRLMRMLDETAIREPTRGSASCSRIPNPACGPRRRRAWAAQGRRRTCLASYGSHAIPTRT